MDRAAAFGSAAMDKAEITATPSAPAAMVSAALLSSIPAMAPTGISGARLRIAAAIARKPSAPIGGSGLSFDMVSYTPPMQT